MARNDQIVRILSVARALASTRRGISPKALAEREGWNWRTVYRDIEALEAAGFPIEKDGGRVRLPRDWALPCTCLQATAGAAASTTPISAASSSIFTPIEPSWVTGSGT